MATPLIDLATLQEYVNVKTPNTQQLAVLNAAITWVSDKIVAWCGQEIASTVATVQFNGTDTNYFAIPNYPVDNSVAPQLNYCLVTPQTPGQAIDWVPVPWWYGYQFNSDGKNAVLYSNAVLCQRYIGYQLIYTYGYTTIPPEINRIACEMADIVWKNSDQSGTGGGRLGVDLSKWDIQAMTWQKFLDMEKTWRQQLAPYKIFV